MNKQKEIKEMAEDLQYCIVYESDDSWQAVFDEFAENFYNEGYRKIPENAVVLSKEEYINNLTKYYGVSEIKDIVRKEMAEKIMIEISGDSLTVNTKEYGNIEVVPVDRISEICENIAKGDKR